MTAHAVTVALADGQELTIRPLRPDDGERLGVYLEGLSEDTRSRWGPHRFDRETAQAICSTLDGDPVLRVVGTVGEEERFVAYVLLHLGVRESDGRRYARLGIPLDAATDASLAPSVADAFQEHGVGTLVVRHALALAAAEGRTRVVLWDGVQERNARAVRFYTKLGFRKVGEFVTERNNFDMIREG